MLVAIGDVTHGERLSRKFIHSVLSFCCVIAGSLVAIPLTATGVAASDSVLLEFSSPNCPPCRAMQPIVSELIARGVPVRQVNVQSEPHLARRFGIRSTPTFIVLREGKEVTRLLGSQTASKLYEALAKSSSGPLIPTRSQVASPKAMQAGTLTQPQTRLAPLGAGTRDRAFQSSTSPSVRQDQSSATKSGWSPQTTSLASRRSQQANHSQQSNAPAAMEAMPSLTLADAVERAQAATVRLRVYDGRGFGAGTGTLIDTHGEEALVLTCGHLFRDGEGKDRIEVDLFVGGVPVTVEGKLIDFDAGDRDIGLVAIRPGIDVQPVTVIQDGESARVGQTAFSFGCDRGDPPSRRDTRITGVNKYNQNIGGSNLEVSGAPIDGRSGGGLFDDRGRLIGVCNAADYKSDLGIYTGPGSIHWQLDRIQMAHLYQSESDSAPVASSPVTALPDLPASLNPADTVNTNSDAMEMIVILRDQSGSQREQVLTLSRPEAALVERIRQAARR